MNSQTTTTTNVLETQNEQQTLIDSLKSLTLNELTNLFLQVKETKKQQQIETIKQFCLQNNIDFDLLFSKTRSKKTHNPRPLIEIIAKFKNNEIKTYSNYNQIFKELKYPFVKGDSNSHYCNLTLQTGNEKMKKIEFLKQNDVIEFIYKYEDENVVIFTNQTKTSSQTTNQTTNQTTI